MKILIVEDDPQMGELIERGLTAEGYDIRVVDNGVDAGPIISQRRVPVLPGDTESTLHDRIKPVERELLVQAVLDIANGAIDLSTITAATAGTAASDPRSAQ